MAVTRDQHEAWARGVIQITTPHQTGSGFYLGDYELYVTSEHVVRDSQQVVIQGAGIERQLATVVMLDPIFDLAFLRAGVRPEFSFSTRSADPYIGEEVYATGHPYGEEFSLSMGVVSNDRFAIDGKHYVQHDAPLHPGKSGGPLLDGQGMVVGVNGFLHRENRSASYALPVHILNEALESFQSLASQSAVVCAVCTKMVAEPEAPTHYCPHCGAEIVFVGGIEAFQPTGIGRTIEGLLEELGANVMLSRSGWNQWEVSRGSARITLFYHEKSGVIVGESVLCTLPDTEIDKIYAFLLQQNAALRSLSFSIRGMEVVLSILIYDQFLDERAGKKLLYHLFEKSDEYDNILVEQWGGHWVSSDQN